MFRASLNSRLQQWLANQINATTWDLNKLVSNVITIDNNWRQMKSWQRPTMPSTSAPRSQPQPQPRQLQSQPQQGPRSFSDAAKQRYFGPMPMEVDAVRPGRVTPEERERRRALGLCYYCGKDKHQAINCPNNLSPCPGQPQQPRQGPPPQRRVNNLNANLDTASEAGGVAIEDLKADDQ